MTTTDDRARRRRLDALIALSDRLSRNTSERTKLLDRRDRKIIEAMHAGDSASLIADAAGVDRTMVYVISSEGRDRKGTIEST